MASIPASELAREILESCLKDGIWPARTLDDLIERALDEDDAFVSRAATRALFAEVIEPLGDLFEPSLCDVYARLFAHVISRVLPDYLAEELVLRYRRIRQIRRFPGGEVRRVFVLSRVTLGADVAVTSVALAAAKERFPEADICLVGPEKNAGLFSADSRITAVPLPYGRGSLLRERLESAVELQAVVHEAGSIVIDPDSRLTQLGLIPVSGDDARYFFFESRAFGGEAQASLPKLTADWLTEVFDVRPLRPYVAPAKQPKVADVAVSFGVGDNPAKRLDEDFEQRVLVELVSRGLEIILDRGAGGEEAARVDRLIERMGSPALLHVHEGSYASFASHIEQSSFYVGYDSAGQHVAAAADVPLVSVFKGYVGERMLSRWRPDSPQAQVVAVDESNEATALARTLAAIASAAEAARTAMPRG